MPFLWCQMPFHVNSILDLQYLHFLKGKTKCQQVFINNGFTNSSFKKRRFVLQTKAFLLISFVFSKKSEIPATACRNLEGISKAPSRIQYPEHTLDTDIMSKQSRDILRLADDKDGYDNIPNHSNRKSIFFKVWGKTSMKWLFVIYE